MDPAIARQLQDKIYDKRKTAAQELEKQIREFHQLGDERRIGQVIDQLVDFFSNISNPLHVRNGGLIGLAGTGIALLVDIAPYMEKFVEPLLVCFSDPESRIRYFSAECLYNIAKVSKGEILVYFNPIFDAVSKLSADSELSVKNGAELLDRLLKDIVAESASVYIPQYPETERVRQRAQDFYEQQGVLVALPDDGSGGKMNEDPGSNKAFSLAHFIPLLVERIEVLNPFTRSYLVSWITVLDSVPELQLVTYLPEFLHGLLRYLSDPSPDVKVATENLLAEFLREIKHITGLRRRQEEKLIMQKELDQSDAARRQEKEEERLPDITMTPSDSTAFLPDGGSVAHTYTSETTFKDDLAPEHDDRDSGVWYPGQGVRVDHAAIVEILIQHLDPTQDEIQQSTALQWIGEFLSFAHETMVPFTPRLITAVLPNLAHHVLTIQSAANHTNQQLFNVIRNLPSPTGAAGLPAVPTSSASSLRTTPSSPPPPPLPTLSRSSIPVATRENSQHSQHDASEQASNGMPPTERVTPLQTVKPKTQPLPEVNSVPASSLAEPPSQSSRPNSPASQFNAPAMGVVIHPSPGGAAEELDPFDYQATVNALTIQFLAEHEDTRIAALKWLIMLHQKAPKKILAMDDETFPVLLKTLSDPAEEVVKYDLQLLAQISSSSEESYFKSFMMNLLELFCTDKRLLETRGSLIIRHLCLCLNTERIYRAFAEILEKEEDLEFASLIVQKLNIILITSPELVDLRRRLKSLETRQDGQTLFISLYRCWCHNAVSVFSLCLLAQAYEHASNLLQIFPDLEINVQLLVQIDRLVQLIESPIFTYLRLQLLEPEKYPYLFKCLYGLLMLLPQSTAFVALRNRLNAVNSTGFMHITPRPSTVASSIATRSKLGREEIKWQELLSHFRSVQLKHEKSRRQSNYGNDSLFVGSFTSNELTQATAPGSPTKPLRRKVTNEGLQPRGQILSPLNPRARTNGVTPSVLGLAPIGGRVSPSGTSKQKRALSLNRKN
ncbi:ARM repeat-containing protein [Sistotremastrum niveocremeum HHB9708]|uniref:ARM repeat-containing protein n=2 Tax=Sistotremastraceae TaxID=3402574 RepID=A0A164ZUB5_9AGAM|nr:ARM repeat-containing protein [Sistotremastrum niveocremeum HHB9708]KZT35551.1 ARM repeat-containing protein [Sistotremastrum suecicum HHB10207 ss-3]